MAIKSKIKGKKKKKNNPTSQKWKKYTIEGDTIKRAKSCPRCGPGIFLSVNSERLYCGKCHYTEFLTGNRIESKDQPEEKPISK
jgi:ubiquitin-small subunit ribosomal protein S27Ae